MGAGKVGFDIDGKRVGEWERANDDKNVWPRLMGHSNCEPVFCWILSSQPSLIMGFRIWAFLRSSVVLIALLVPSVIQCYLSVVIH